ncbi:DUF3108 domain-containing protein [Chitinophaga jiangningensis]|nr:hypothetical protein [Chitinophaga jiangningensis]
MPFRPVLLLLLPLASFAQKTVVPGSPDINTSRLQTGKSKFTIYYFKDNKWDVKGTYTNDLTIAGNELKFAVEYIDDKNKWYRSRLSIADAKTFSPVSYTTKGLKNSLELKFGNPITGKYQYVNGDKDKPVSIKTSEKFVDFNVAEIMLTTLPLTTGYKATMPQFYLGNSPDSVVSNYTIKDVKSFIYQSPKTGKHESWLLSLLEE